MTPELILQWAHDSGFGVSLRSLREVLVMDATPESITRFASLIEQHVRAEENEACAKVLEGEHMWLNAAAAIRARKP